MKVWDVGQPGTKIPVAQLDCLVSRVGGIGALLQGSERQPMPRLSGVWSAVAQWPSIFLLLVPRIVSYMFSGGKGDVQDRRLRAGANQARLASVLWLL